MHRRPGVVILAPWDDMEAPFEAGEAASIQVELEAILRTPTHFDLNLLRPHYKAVNLDPLAEAADFLRLDANDLRVSEPSFVNLSQLVTLFSHCRVAQSQRNRA